MHQDILVVSDTGKNRILIWENFKQASHQNVSIVLGQKEVNDTGRNGGEMVSAVTLQYPSGIWTDGKKLIVADAWNHRVLIWLSFPTVNGQAADVVLGQVDFNSNQANIKGVGNAPSSQSLYWPYGVWSDGISLWIADTGNRRVLFYKTIPKDNFAAADEVIGQINFEEKEYDPNHAIWPYSIKVSKKGELMIADVQYYRVLYWEKWQSALEKSADIIIGQPNIQSNGQNQYRMKPAANTLNWCYDCCFHKEGIIVADTGNSRLTIWNQIPNENSQVADTLIGQPNFEINGESSLSVKTSLINEMYWPFAVNSIDDFLVIADTGNHKILIYKPIPN
jgi:hypothetical protein